MTEERTRQETEKPAPKALSAASPSSSLATAPGALRASSRSPSSSSLHSSHPVTRLRYRQLVQPITPTECEPAPEDEPTPSADSQTDRTQPLGPPLSPSTRMRHPRVPLSSLDLAKSRIYTRLLYFFDANTGASATASTACDPPQGPLFTTVDSSSSTSAGAGKGATTPTTAPSQESSASPQIPPSSANKKYSSRSNRLHYHYHQSPFMDPMLLQASLALVLSDFFPLAGRLCNGPQQSSLSSSSTPAVKEGTKNDTRPFIECNDHGVLFAVADTSTTMAQIQQGHYQDGVLPPQLFPVGLYPASLRDPPLLGIQLTYTQDQSLIMGVAMDSSVMDAVSLVSFMEAWSRITQGKDFSPYPILDRSFLEKLGVDDHASTNGASSSHAGAIYRHQRINNSPPPPIVFDNGLDTDLDRGLGDSDHATDDDDEDGDDDNGTDMEDYTDDEKEGDSNLKRAQRRLQSIQSQEPVAHGLQGTGKGVAGRLPTVTVHFVEHLDGPAEDILDLETNGPEAVPGAEVEGSNDLRLFHFTPEQLDRIKQLASEQNIAAAACAADDKEISDKWVSTGDSLIAYLWKMSTITRRLEPDCKLMCGLVMDIRNRVTPTIPEGFIGNAILSIFVQMPVHSLLTTPLSLPSRLLRDELLLQTPEQIRSAISWIQKQEHPHLIETASNNPFGHDFMVWSFRKLNMYSPDFGQGRPCKVRIGRGGFGGGEGMCVIMDSEPSRAQAAAAGGSSSAGMLGDAGVDVYLGLQGEHLLDFEKVHRGFMEGLLIASLHFITPPFSMTITIIRQAPSSAEVRIRYTQDNVTLHVTPVSSLIQNPGTLYIADESLYFFSAVSNTGFSIPYPSIIIHAIARESHVGPSIYCQLEGSLASSEPAASNGQAAKGEEEEEEDDEEPVLELSFVPTDVASLDTIYENLSYCASLHQDEDAEDYNMDEDDIYQDDEEDHQELYANADIQGGYVPKSSTATSVGVASAATTTAGAGVGSAAEEVEQVPAIDLQSGEWYTGNPESDAKFELSEQGQVIVNQWDQNQKSGGEGQPVQGKRVRQEEGDGAEDDSMDVVEGDAPSQANAEEAYTEEQQQEARSKMWRAY
ncbi:hypothetical protein BGZ75_006064 [Mortierella antarctica]|nr:hypothetical protein BGZ75_006064 [Mortierella antarctica]